MGWRHRRYSESRVTVCTSKFDLDAMGFMSPEPESADVLRVLAASPSYELVAMKRDVSLLEGGRVSRTRSSQDEEADESGQDGLESKRVPELREAAKELGIKTKGLVKAELVDRIRAERRGRCTSR